MADEGEILERDICGLIPAFGKIQSPNKSDEGEEEERCEKGIYTLLPSFPVMSGSSRSFRPVPEEDRKPYECDISVFAVHKFVGYLFWIHANSTAFEKDTGCAK
jgi:hypothetical protein